MSEADEPVQQDEGLTPEDYYYLKCWVTLIKVGKRLLIEVLLYGCPSLTQIPVRQALHQISSYSNGNYKGDFNKEERHKVENGILNDYDITLLYKLIIRLCCLIPINVGLNAMNVSQSKLALLLFEVKNLRNKFAHPLTGMTEENMFKVIDEMSTLFNSVIDETANTFLLDDDKISLWKNTINSDISTICRSPLPATTICQQLQQVAQEKARLILQEGTKDLEATQSSRLVVSVSPWTMLKCRQNIKDVFLNPLIQFEKLFCLQQNLSDSESIVDYRSLLVKTHLSGTGSKMVLLNGPPGVGKTFLLTFLYSCWFHQTESSIEGIDMYDFAFFIDFRTSMASSLGKLLSQILPNTSILFGEEELKKVILTMKCLFLFDNMDDVDYSLSVIDEIMTGSANVKIIATTTKNTPVYLLENGSKPNPLQLALKGLCTDSLLPYINMLNKSIPEPDRLTSTDVHQFMLTIQACGPQEKEWTQNPELMKHIFFYRCLSPNSANVLKCVTVTNILMHSFRLVLSKLKEKCASRSFPGVVDQALLEINLLRFLQELGKIAITNLQRTSKDLTCDSLLYLIQKCEELKLPSNVLLPAFLNFRDVSDDKWLQQSVTFGFMFPVAKLQEFYAAYYLFIVISQLQSITPICDILPLKSLSATEIGKTKLTGVIKFLVGLLALNEPKLLESRCYELIAILKIFCSFRTAVQWLNILEESQSIDSMFKKEIIKELNGYWIAEDFRISMYFVSLIKSTPPKSLVLVSLQNPDDLPHLKDAIRCCQTSNNMIQLSLHLYFHFWRFHENSLSDCYLELISCTESKCHLISFAGHLSPETYSQIPRNIKRLALQCTLEHVNALNKELKLLSELEVLSLSIFVDKDRNADNETLTQLCFDSNSDMKVSLEVFGFSYDSMESQCLIVQRLFKRYTRLAVHRTSFCSKHVEDSIRTLAGLGVSVSSLVIGSTATFTRQNIAALDILAKRKLHTTAFKLIQL